MVLLELAHDIGLDLKKTSNSRGGEYHSSCPRCNDGNDRFVVWPKINRFWCRRCSISGDAIQFCRDFMNMSFRESCERVNETSLLANYQEQNRTSIDKLVLAAEPPQRWQEKAMAFVEWSQKQLFRSPSAMQALCQRGLREETIKQFKLGFCKHPGEVSKDFYRDRESWGLLPECKEDGTMKKLWLPTGLVIPTISDSDCVIKLKVRRQQWHKDDSLPKYVEISGSKQSPSLYGFTENQAVVVVESELDAMLIQQSAKDVCFCIALGGVTKKPDLQCDHLLRETRCLLWCLDNDEAGKNAALWWRNTYSHLKFWPAPIGKSPGDAFKDHGVNLREWILRGIAHHSSLK